MALSFVPHQPGLRPLRRLRPSCPSHLGRLPAPGQGLPRPASWAALWPRSVAAGRLSRVQEAWRRTRDDFSIAMALLSRIGNWK
jgi:hypothetical protein